MHQSHVVFELCTIQFILYYNEPFQVEKFNNFTVLCSNQRQVVEKIECTLTLRSSGYAYQKIHHWNVLTTLLKA